MEEGHQHCEEAFLAVAARYGLCRPAARMLSLEDILRAHSSLVGAHEGGKCSCQSHAGLRSMARWWCAVLTGSPARGWWEGMGCPTHIA